MQFKIIIFLSFISYLLLGCTTVPNEMQIAERIIDAHPDSALFILQHLKPEKNKSNSSRALYGLLLFHALERADKKMQPDSVIDFSISYYKSKNDNLHLAGCYFYKGHMFKHAQRFDEASGMYLKSLDCLRNKKEYNLLGRIYSDMGDIYSFQSNYTESLKKYQSSLDYLTRAGKKTDACFVILSIGRNFSINKKSKTAQKYFRQAIFKVNDSILIGAAFQEIGNDYYKNKQLDSAQYYIRKSLGYPYRSTSYSIRNYILADILFDLEQYDESNKYALIALKHDANFYTQRECYRILVNVEYLRSDIHQMGKYMTKFQSCTDSVQKINSQTKIEVLENLHNTTQEARVTKRDMILIVLVLLIVLLLSSVIVLFLYKRNMLKKDQLHVFKLQLNKKQEFVSDNLSKKIAETRSFQTDMRKNASVLERNMLDKEMYNNALHLDDWNNFSREMNHAFNNIILTLNSDYPSINHKEIAWCCMHLLDIPHADRMLLLEASSDSLYKLKQRLAQKLNLKNTKDLDMFLKGVIALRD